MARTQQQSKLEEAIIQYSLAWEDVGLVVPEGSIDTLRRMWWDGPGATTVLPPSPPGGWSNYNMILGGIPYHAAWSPYPDKDRDYPIGHSARYRG